METHDGATLQRAISSARGRLLPFLILMYLMAFLDRANVGFAKNVLQADTGLSDAAFAFGAGVFFVGYAIFELPSNLMMHRFGARTWVSRIMVTWGIVSACTAFVHDANSFYVQRIMLGLAEAGFFPAIIVYLTNWFPSSTRAQAMGAFYFGFPLAFLLGSPVSGMLLDATNPFHLLPWQWLFVVEGLAASVVGVAAWFYLTDHPAQAHWMPDDQRDALVAAMRAEDAHKRAHGPVSVPGALSDGRVWACCAIYFAMQIAVYGVVFYLPTRIAALMGGGHVGTKVGFVTAIPWVAAIVGTYVVTRTADRVGHHRLWAAGMLVVAAIGIAGSTLTASVPIGVAAFCAATIGFVSVQPLFWTLPSNYLAGIAAAGGIALINSLGNLGGFVAPNLKAAAERWAGPSAGMLTLAMVAVIGALMLLAFRPKTTAAAALQA
ncbi:MAG TPA: MFS transporter [Pararobbsia sp.]|nr:MFS transporter [Pararobbsia sp.]